MRWSQPFMTEFWMIFWSCQMFLAKVKNSLAKIMKNLQFSSKKLVGTPCVLKRSRENDGQLIRLQADILQVFLTSQLQQTRCCICWNNIFSVSKALSTWPVSIKKEYSQGYHLGVDFTFALQSILWLFFKCLHNTNMVGDGQTEKWCKSSKLNSYSLWSGFEIKK